MPIRRPTAQEGRRPGTAGVTGVACGLVVLYLFRFRGVACVSCTLSYGDEVRASRRVVEKVCSIEVTSLLAGARRLLYDCFVPMAVRSYPVSG